MSNYNTLKANIAQYIKENHQNDITGNLLQQQLLAIVNSLGVGYQYVGIATPETNPGTPDQRVFYFAYQAGNYINFGSSFIFDGRNLVIFYYSDSWNAIVVDVPTTQQTKEISAYINGAKFGLLINKSYQNTTGIVLDIDGWVATDKMPLFGSGKIEINANNSLGYYLWNVMCYDADGAFIGYYDLPHPSYSVDTTTILAQYPDTKFVAFNIWGGSVHAALSLSDVADIQMVYIADDALIHKISVLETDVAGLQTNVGKLQEIVGVEEKAILLLNKSYSQFSGIAGDVDGWIATEEMQIVDGGTIKINDDNTLGYYFWNIMCYDSSHTFLGYIGLAHPSYSVDVSTIKSQYANTTYVAFNIWGGSVHAALSLSDVADMIVSQETTDSLVSRMNNAEADIEQLQEIVGGISGVVELTVDLSAKTIAIKSELSPKFMIVNRGYWKDAEHFTYNPCFNFGGTDIINRTSGVTTRINNEADNLGAPNTQVGFIGANHGLYYVFVATINNHGKTFVDIGSEWTGSDGNKWYIVRIVDTNKIAFVSEPYLVSGVYNFRIMSSGITLTHSSGATHTDSMTIGTVERNQWYPSEKVSEQKVLLDGKEMTESGTFDGKVVDFLEVYDVYNPVSYLNKIRSLVGTLTDNPLPGNYSDIAKWFRICNDYRFTKGGCNVLFVDWIALDTLDLGLFNPIDVKVMNLTYLGGGGQYYLPKALPITVDGQTFDYRRPATFDYSKDLHWTEQYWENPNLPPDRGIEFITDGTQRIVGLHHGYLFDQGIGGLTRKDYLTDAWWIYTSGAVYAGGVNGGKYGNTQRQQIGSHYGFAAFRKYEDVSENDTGVISVSQFDANDKHYIYVDVEANGIFPVEIADDWCGKEITILEKSDNVTLLNDFSQKQIMISVTNATPMYGYLVAEIVK